MYPPCFLVSPPTTLTTLTMEHERSTHPPIDRISDLPVEIIHNHILTSLPVKYVKVMSTVSKRWFDITTSFPPLVFDDSYISTDEFVNQIRRKFQWFGVHEFHLKNLNKLGFRFRFNPELAPFLDRWIEFALQFGGVEEFDFKIKNSPLEDNFLPRGRFWYELPGSVFPATSIKAAEISGCSLLQAFSGELKGSFKLQKLVLDRVKLSEEAVSNIISSFPLLKELGFLSCGGNLNRLRISNLPKLKDLRIYEWNAVQGPVVEIDAPSLENLAIHGGPRSSMLDYDLYLQDILSNLPSLRSLHLTGIPLLMLTKLKFSSSTLQELVIQASIGFVKLEIDAPNLVSANYHGAFDPLLFSPTCTWNRVSTKYYGYPIYERLKVEEFLVDMFRFFSNKKRMEYLFVSLSIINPCFSFQKLKERVKLNERVVVRLPAENIDEVELAFNFLRSKDCANLLDGVLWICHPRTLSLKFDHNYYNINNHVVNHICDLVIRHRHRDRCTCQYRKRWIHCLEEITMVKEDGTEDRLPMDGTSLPDFSSYDKIKFIFKWQNEWKKKG